MIEYLQRALSAALCRSRTSDVVLLTKLRAQLARAARLAVELSAGLPPDRRHRPWFKVAINTVLRFFQTRRRPARLFVLISIFEDERLVGYRFGRMLHLPEPEDTP